MVHRLTSHGFVWFIDLLHMDLYGSYTYFTWICMVHRLTSHGFVWFIDLLHMDLYGS